MTHETISNLYGFYAIAGILYCVINGAFRKLEADYMLTFVWITMWPLCLLCLGASRIKPVSKFLYKKWTYVKTRI